jgi:hypothetical protein
MNFPWSGLEREGGEFQGQRHRFCFFFSVILFSKAHLSPLTFTKIMHLELRSSFEDVP